MLELEEVHVALVFQMAQHQLGANTIKQPTLGITSPKESKSWDISFGITLLNENLFKEYIQ
jgi:hypothetical protein